MRLAAEVERLQAELADVRASAVKLETTADVDPLLGILNRRGLERELSRSLAFVARYGTPAALIYLDLDDFKPINDHHGHAAGDAMLRAVAAALLRAVRASDLVGRIGGDEFVMLLWNLGADDAEAKAAAIETAVEEAKATWDDWVLTVGASAGVTMIGARDDVASVIARADRAMYVRKAAHRAGRARSA